MPFRSRQSRAAHGGALGLVAALAVAAPSFAAGPVAPGAAGTVVRGVPGQDGPLRLALALAAARENRPLEVERVLAGVEFTTPPPFDGSDRAAWLLAQAHLALGENAGFDALADAVATWPSPGPWARALLAERALRAGGPAAIEASRTLGLPRLAADAEGAEHLAAALRTLEAGGDPRHELAGVPDGSASGRDARDLAARVTWERGDSATADRMLVGLGREGRTGREAWARLADDALAAGDAEDAWERWRTLEDDWTRSHVALGALAIAPGRDSLVALWEADPARSGAPLLAPARGTAAASTLARAALGDPGGRAFDALDRAARPEHDALADLLPPTPAEWEALTASGSRAAAAAGVASHAAADAAREHQRLVEWRAYLAAGRGRVADEDSALAARLARLERLRAGLDRLDERLRAVRDSASARVLARARLVRAQCDADARWIAGMRHFWIEGPARHPVPAGAAGPAAVLAAEDALADRLAALADSLATRAPGVIAASYRHAWRPGILDRIADENAAALAARRHALALAASLDSSLAVARQGATLRALTARADRLALRADSLARDDRRVRSAVAARSVSRSLAALEREREGIDYGLATSAWALAAASDGGGGSAVDSMDVESPGAAHWRAEAIARLQAFLARHPGSDARADARFRLADLLEQRARAEFRAGMQEHLAHPDGPLPVLDTAPAIALYRALLRDDAGGSHRDAVLYDLGTLLAERGDPEAVAWFRQLVDGTPASPWAQESWLRLADAAFDGRRFADATPLYRQAASGADTTLRVIALYKLGWTELHEDHAGPAVDAFGAVLDLYAEGRVDGRLRLDDESRTLCVTALARAGGAPAAAAWFDRAGPRPYQLGLLEALGAHFRRYAMPEAAVAADEQVLQRFGLAPQALDAARRIDATYARWSHPRERDAALLADGERFVHGSPWWSAQSPDSLRAAGDAFARAALLAVAGERQRAGRTGGGESAWREAALLGERVLSTWPEDPDRRRVALLACEARAAMHDVPEALAHAAIAAQGRDSLAAAGALARVAVLDAWYERERAAAHAPTGPDSIANAVVDAGDALLADFPDDPHAPDVRWREAQLTFAHGAYERSADVFARFASAWPDDARAPRAAALRGDALVRAGRFSDAGAAYEQALAVARRAGADSLARRLAPAIPACAYRDAETRAAADSTAFAANAARFADVARRWPGFEHADVALYRAGLAWFHAGRTAEGAQVMAELATTHRTSALVRDARRATAMAWEADGDTAAAARAWLEVATRYRGEPGADDAALRAALEFDRVNEPVRADSLRLAWVRRHPEDPATSMALLEPVVSRSLDSVTTARPVSRWLPAVRRGTPPRTAVASYLARARVHPDLASPALLARVEFLQGEEAAARCAAVALRQPLARSIARRRARLEEALARYRAAAARGVDEWAHASAFRIGESLAAFGEAIEASERPADLAGADRVAYDEVIHRQAATFAERAREVWRQALSAGGDGAGDAWLARARAALESMPPSRRDGRTAVDAGSAPEGRQP